MARPRAPTWAHASHAPQSSPNVCPTMSQVVLPASRGCDYIVITDNIVCRLQYTDWDFFPLLWTVIPQPINRPWCPYHKASHLLKPSTYPSNCCCSPVAQTSLALLFKLERKPSSTRVFTTDLSRRWAHPWSLTSCSLSKPFLNSRIYDHDVRRDNLSHGHVLDPVIKICKKNFTQIFVIQEP